MSLAITELAAFAERLADASGPIARGYFRSGLNIDIKADDSPVTRADREVEAHLREMIAATYPVSGKRSRVALFYEQFGDDFG